MAVQWLELYDFTAEDLGSILQVTRDGQNEKNVEHEYKKHAEGRW